MNNTVIKIENLGKRYLLMHQRREDLLYNVLANKLKLFCGRVTHPFKRSNSNSNLEEFWALKNLSFFRWCVQGASVPLYILYIPGVINAFVISILVFFSGVWFFRRFERSFADFI